jgi:putative transposase
MLKAYKYRIYPDADQRSVLANIFGQVRFVYNLGLETKISAYAANETNVTCFDLNKQITELKNDCEWLKICPAQALQMAMRNLDNAYHAFFRGAGFPKFKSKHKKQSFQLPQGVKLSEDNTKVYIPKLKWVDIDLHRKYKGEIKTVTVSKTPTDKYFISILVETGGDIPNKKPITKSNTVGVDLGIKDFAITSDGKKFDNKDFFKSQMKKLRVAQRSLARKVKGSKNYEAQKKVVALLHEKVRNQRNDYLHKISSYLVNTYDTICIEDLAVCNMVKNHNLARAISDMGWGNFKNMLTYKSEWYGKNLIMINRFDPSSKTCSSCGKINKELTLNDRVWTCTKCNTTHDRDVNAAINIKTFGLRNKPVMPEREALACAWYEEAPTLT